MQHCRCSMNQHYPDTFVHLILSAGTRRSWAFPLLSGSCFFSMGGTVNIFFHGRKRRRWRMRIQEKQRQGRLLLRNLPFFPLWWRTCLVWNSIACLPANRCCRWWCPRLEMTQRSKSCTTLCSEQCSVYPRQCSSILIHTLINTDTHSSILIHTHINTDTHSSILIHTHQYWYTPINTDTHSSILIHTQSDVWSDLDPTEAEALCAAKSVGRGIPSLQPGTLTSPGEGRSKERWLQHLGRVHGNVSCLILSCLIPPSSCLILSSMRAHSLILSYPILYTAICCMVQILTRRRPLALALALALTRKPRGVRKGKPKTKNKTVDLDRQTHFASRPTCTSGWWTPTSHRKRDRDRCFRMIIRTRRSGSWAGAWTKNGTVLIRSWIHIWSTLMHIWSTLIRIWSTLIHIWSTLIHIWSTLIHNHLILITSVYQNAVKNSRRRWTWMKKPKNMRSCAWRTRTLSWWFVAWTLVWRLKRWRTWPFNLVHPTLSQPPKTHPTLSNLIQRLRLKSWRSQGQKTETWCLAACCMFTFALSHAMPWSWHAAALCCSVLL